GVGQPASHGHCLGAGARWRDPAGSRSWHRCGERHGEANFPAGNGRPHLQSESNVTEDLRFPRGLYGISPEWDDTDRLLVAIEAAASGGMTAFQWRRKNATADEGVKQARLVVERCRELGVVSIINDDWRLAALVDADGVHLGRDDGGLTEARVAMGPDRIIGCSCYNEPALAELAMAAE